MVEQGNASRAWGVAFLMATPAHRVDVVALMSRRSLAIPLSVCDRATTIPAPNGAVFRVSSVAAR